MYEQVPKRDLRRAEAQNNTFERATPSPTSGAFLAATKGELDSAIKELVDLTGRLDALGDRLFGSRPETTGECAGTGSVGNGGGIAAEIESRVNYIRQLVQTAHFNAARLESL